VGEENLLLRKVPREFSGLDRNPGPHVVSHVYSLVAGRSCLTR